MSSCVQIWKIITKDVCKVNFVYIFVQLVWTVLLVIRSPNLGPND